MDVTGSALSPEPGLPGRRRPSPQDEGVGGGVPCPDLAMVAPVPAGGPLFWPTGAVRLDTGRWSDADELDTVSTPASRAPLTPPVSSLQPRKGSQG